MPSELKAYEGISQSYFYLGKTAKARYYFERHSRGKYEAPFSTLKKIYQTKHQDKFNALKLKEKVNQYEVKRKQQGELVVKRAQKLVKDSIRENVDYYNAIFSKYLGPEEASQMIL